MARLVESSTAVPIGTVKDYAGSTAPEGFLLCFGQALSVVTNPEYAGLFGVIGNTFGGTNNTNFVVPDLRGRSVSGKDNMGGTAASRLTAGGSGITGTTLGGAGGTETHTLTTAQLAVHNHGGATGSHTHDATPSDNSGSMSGGFGGTIVSTGNVSVRTSAAGNQTPPINAIATTKTNTASISSDGSGSAHNNTQPTMILNKIIKF